MISYIQKTHHNIFVSAFLYQELIRSTVKKLIGSKLGSVQLRLNWIHDLTKRIQKGVPIYPIERISSMHALHRPIHEFECVPYTSELFFTRINVIFSPSTRCKCNKKDPRQAQVWCCFVCLLHLRKMHLISNKSCKTQHDDHNHHNNTTATQ